MILCGNAFPSTEELRSMAIQAYHKALQKPEFCTLFVSSNVLIRILMIRFKDHSAVPPYPSAMALRAVSDSLLSLTVCSILGVLQIRSTASVVRNHLKMVCEDVVPRQYNLHSSPQLPPHQQRQDISATVQNLLTDATYSRVRTLYLFSNVLLYLQYSQDPNPDGDKYFAHPAAYEIARIFLHDPRKGLAHGKEGDFNPFPLECVALIYSGVCAAACCQLLTYITSNRFALLLTPTRLELKFHLILLENCTTRGSII